MHTVEAINRWLAICHVWRWTCAHIANFRHFLSSERANWRLHLTDNICLLTNDFWLWLLSLIQCPWSDIFYLWQWNNRLFYITLRYIKFNVL